MAKLQNSFLICSDKDNNLKTSGFYHFPTMTTGETNQIDNLI